MTGAFAIATGLGIAAMVWDVGWRRVPNWLTASGVAMGLACAIPGGWRGFGLAAGGAALGFLLLLPFHWCGAMGGGDVKLMAAYGAFLGPAGILLAVSGPVFLGLAGPFVPVAGALSAVLFGGAQMWWGMLLWRADAVPGRRT